MRIRVVRSGGFAGLRVERAVETDALPALERGELERLVADACFFDLPARATCGMPDVIQYRVTIESGGREHEVTTDDRTAAAGVMRLVEFVLGAG